MNKLFLLICLCILFSCSKLQNKEREINYLQADNLEIISLPIDETINQMIDHPQLIDDSTLLYLNKYNNELVFHEFKEDGEIRKKIMLVLNGPDAVGKISQFLYHQQDSIFLIDSYQYKVSIIDQEHGIIKQFKLFKDPKSEASILPNPTQFYAPPIFNKGKLYVAGIYDGNINAAAYYDSAKSMIVYDVQQNTTSLQMPYPEIYQRKNFPAFYSFYGRVYNADENKIIFSFMADNHLQIYDTNQPHKQSFEEAATTYIGEIKGIAQRQADDINNNLMAKNMPKYHMVFYDPYRKYYYRLYSAYTENEKEINGILVLDQEMQLLREYIFSDKVSYNPFNIVVHSEALFIQVLDGKEDFITYQKLKLWD